MVLVILVPKAEIQVNVRGGMRKDSSSCVCLVGEETCPCEGKTDRPLHSPRCLGAQLSDDARHLFYRGLACSAHFANNAGRPERSGLALTVFSRYLVSALQPESI